MRRPHDSSPSPETVERGPVVDPVLRGQDLLVPVGQDTVLLEVGRDPDASAGRELDGVEVGVADGLVQGGGVELGGVALVGGTLCGGPVLIDLENRTQKSVTHPFKQMKLGHVILIILKIRPFQCFQVESQLM